MKHAATALLVLAIFLIPCTANAQDPGDERPVSPFVVAGFHNVFGSTGLELGGGLLVRPFPIRGLVVLGDVSLTRFGADSMDLGIGSVEQEAFNMFNVSANVLYQFTNLRARPYVGGGLVYSNASTDQNISLFGEDIGSVESSGSDSALQLVGGLVYPVSNLRLHAQVKARFYTGDSGIAVLVGVGF